MTGRDCRRRAARDQAIQPGQSNQAIQPGQSREIPNKTGGAAAAR